MNVAVPRVIVHSGLVVLVSTLLAMGCNGMQENDGVSPMSDRELIVLAAPQDSDAYYAEVSADIINFHIAYAKKILENDAVLILADADSYQSYVDAIGEENVVVAPQADIWARDFSLSNATLPIMFRYTAAGQAGGEQAQSDADSVQETLAELMEEAGLEFTESDLLNDGGNFVDDYAGRAVVSRKFLTDNRLSEKAARARILAATDIDYIAFIDADEQGGLEHADGVIAFIAPNVLVINSYEEEPSYAEKLRADLRAGLPDVNIHEIVTPYNGTEMYDPSFGSACGLYTNMLVTPNHIYFPQFGIPEDAVALANLQMWTSKKVIPVDSRQVCKMGGGLRCMSWQLRDRNAARLLEWANRQK